MNQLPDALEFAKRGWAVFPVCRGRKLPACQNGFLDATTDPAKIESFFSKGKRNIGIATGDASGIVVIDVDTYKPEHEDAREELKQRLGELPDTYTVRTRAGGWHLYFKMPEGRNLKGFNNVLCPSVDLRANGGYILAAGTHVWKDKYGPDGYHTVAKDLPVAELPKAWADEWERITNDFDERQAEKARRKAQRELKKAGAA